MPRPVPHRPRLLFAPLLTPRVRSMSFVDQVHIEIAAGKGGAGAVAFRHEKFAEFGGPYGGDGGRGGDVIALADNSISTLLDFRYRKIIKAENGAPGGTKRMTGKSGEHEIIRVPVGTLIRDAHTLELLADLSEDGQRVVLATGGKGGLGNCHFTRATHQAPRYAQPGIEGSARSIVLELKLLADIGIIGYPSVGKSTLISVISNARPKIADYHFTTLAPNLGIVRWHDHQSFVVADIPGLIEGAHEGQGLGHQFLRHVERCRALLHVIEVTLQLEGVPDERDPIADYHRIQHELRMFSEALAERPQIIAVGKTDLPYVRERVEELREYFESRGHTFIEFSALTRQGLEKLIDTMGELISKTPVPDAALFTTPDALPIPEVHDDEDEEENEFGDEYDDYDDYDEYDDDDVPATDEEAMERLRRAANMEIIIDDED